MLDLENIDLKVLSIIHIIKNFPYILLEKKKGPSLNPRPWTKSETYWIYSSMGSQVQNKKKTKEMVKIGKRTREREKKEVLLNL